MLLAYRTKKHRITGKTLFYLVYEWEATLPINLKIYYKLDNEQDDSMMHTRLYQLIVKMEDAYLLVVYQRIEKEQ